MITQLSSIIICVKVHFSLIVRFSKPIVVQDQTAAPRWRPSNAPRQYVSDRPIQYEVVYAPAASLWIYFTMWHCLHLTSLFIKPGCLFRWLSVFMSRPDDARLQLRTALHCLLHGLTLVLIFIGQINNLNPHVINCGDIFRMVLTIRAQFWRQ